MRLVRRCAALAVVSLLAVSCSAHHSPSAAVAPSTSAAAIASTTSAAATSPVTTQTPTTTRSTPTTQTTARRPAGTVAPEPSGLPLAYSTGTATRVITVTAPSTSSTTAILRAWQKSTQGWIEYGAPTSAFVGSDGLSAHPSESRSATPTGSFTLTQAFGALADPGTALSYFRTMSADWWISETSSPLYNTHQHCSSQCAFTMGPPNEHLATEVPYYNYAVVIDANTANSPSGVVRGAGSAFFLHVAVGAPTAGCVAIPQDRLVQLLRWLTPAAHPRILIGVG